MTDHADDALLTLNEACEIYFRGKVSPSTLRAEAKRGKLVIERIGRKDFVTPAAIREMREKCRVQQSPRACGSSQKENGATGGSNKPSGASSIEEGNIALASLQASLKKLRKRSPSTSHKSGKSPVKGTVTPIKSSSRTC